MNQLSGQQSKTTQGAIDRVPCPHCGKPQDFRELNSQQLLDTGHEVTCDVCGRLMSVAGIHTIQVIVVRPLQGAARQRTPDAQPARTLAPNAVRRLLRR